MRSDPRLRQPRRISANFANSIFETDAVVQMAERGFLQFAGGGAASRQSAFFVGPNCYFERMSSNDAVIFQGMHDFNRGKRSDVAIEIAAAGNGINVGSE